MNAFFEKIFDFRLVNGQPTLPVIVWAVYAGIMIAVILSLISRVRSYRLVYGLMAAKADSRESAKSFDELGLGHRLIYKIIFRDGSPLRKYIKYDGEKMYLPEEKRIGASLRFSREKHPIMTLVFAAVLFFVVGCLVILYLPQIIDAYKSLVQ